MKPVRRLGQFRKDLRRAAARGRDLSRLVDVIDRLAAGRPLDARHHDHPLRGKWKDYRDCHIGPDWLLIYQVTEEEVVLVRTGSHADIFG
jgi:mRNA interferase YafQ